MKKLSKIISPRQAARRLQLSHSKEKSWGRRTASNTTAIFSLLRPTLLGFVHSQTIALSEVISKMRPAFDSTMSVLPFGRPAGDRILILEDIDGDGVADTSKVYYQGPDVNAALGICVLGNKVIVTCSPNVIVFTDEDGDDKPDKKEYLFRKSGTPQNDHSIHSFQFGPDGKYYWNMGNAGSSVHDKDGTLVYDLAGNPVVDNWVLKSGGVSRYQQSFGVEFNFGGDDQYRDLESPYWGEMVFRCDPDGSNFEVLAHNFRNNYDVTVDSLGSMWQSDNDDDGNFGCWLNYVMEYGNFGYLDEFTGAGWQASRTGMHDEIPKRHWHQNDPGVVPNLYVTGAGAPTCALAYEGRLLPEIFWDQVLFCDHGPGVVWSPTVTKDGAGYSAELVTLMMGDRVKWVRPVDVAVAPDGAVFVTDWYDPVTSWNRMYDLERGRIFRLAPPGHRSEVPEFDFETPEGAVEALKSPTYSVRYLAWTALHEMQETAEPALLNLFNSSDRTRHRARALWLLSKIDGRGEKHIDMASRDGEEDIRLVSVCAARQMNTDITPLLMRLAKDPSPQVRRECAIALRHSESPEAPAVWAELAARHDGEDRWYLEALGIGADRQWDAYFGAWLDKVSPGWNTSSGRDIVWRSRADVTPEYLVKAIGSPDVDIDETERIMRAFDFQAETEAKNRSLRALISDTQAESQKKVAIAASEALLRLEDLDLNAEPALRASVGRMLKTLEGTEQFARLVQRFGFREHYPGLMRVAIQNADNPLGIASAKAILEAGETAIIEDFISGEDIDVAVTVTDLLGNTGVASANQLLVETLQDENINWAVRDQAVRSLVRNRSGIEVTVDLAKAGQFPDELKEVAGAAMARSMNMDAVDEAKKYFPQPPLKNDQELPQMTVLLNYIGDAERGKPLFTKATCNQCHIINGEGTNFGPDLSQIGTKLSKTGLYESIIDPSAAVSPEYKLHSFTLEDGSELLGLLVSETADKVTLRLEGGAVTEYPAEDVVDRHQSLLSPMPTNLVNQISVEELVDLVEYLTTLK